MNSLSVGSLVFFLFIILILGEIIYTLVPFRSILFFKVMKTDTVMQLVFKDLKNKWISPKIKAYIINHLLRYSASISLEHMKDLRETILKLKEDTPLKYKQLFEVPLCLISFILVSKGAAMINASQLNGWLNQGKKLLFKLTIKSEDRINLSLHYIRACIDMKRFKEAEDAIINLRTTFPAMSEDYKNYLLFYEALLFKSVDKKEEGVNIFNSISPHFQEENPTHLLYKLSIQNEMGEYYEETGDSKSASDYYKKTLALIPKVPGRFRSERLVNLEKDVLKKLSSLNESDEDLDDL